MVPQPHPRGMQLQFDSYVAGSDHPALLNGNGGPATPSSDEDGDRSRERIIPIQRHTLTSSDESLGEGFLQYPPPKPAPRSPPQTSPTLEDQDAQMALGSGRTLASIFGTGDRSGRDSGISLRSPIPPPPPEEEYPNMRPQSPPRPPPQQLFTSKLKGFMSSGGKNKAPTNKTGKRKPNFGQIFSTTPQSSPEGPRGSGQGLDLEDFEGEGSPRVRRPSGRFQHKHQPPKNEMELQRSPLPPASGPLSISIQSRRPQPPPPLPSAPPPKLTPTSDDETLIRIQPLPNKKRKNKPASITIRTEEIPPPPPDSDEDNNNMATLPIHKSQLHYGPRSRAPYSPGRVPDVTLSQNQPQSNTTPLSPTRRSPFAGREPGITSYQDHFLYSSLHTETQTQSQSGQPQQQKVTGAEDDYGLPSPEEFFSSGASRRSPSRYDTQPPPPTPATPTPSPVSELPPNRTTPSTSQQQRSAAEAVADLLTSRQPLSLRIHIQKHKTESSYKKTQTFGQAPKKSSGNGGKNGGGEFSESSI